MGSKKNVLLLFLSDIHPTEEKNTKKKQFRYTKYHNYNKTGNYLSVQTNESAIYYLADQLNEKGECLDAVFYFSTNLTQKKLTVFIDDKELENTHEEWFRQRVKYVLSQKGEDGFINCEDNEEEKAQEKGFACFLNESKNEKEENVLATSFFNSVRYDETKDTDECIRQITEMTKKIQEYMMKETGSSEICLFADMTGGFRYASMMMLSVMQLLRQYDGVEIEEVKYSNWEKGEVEDVTELQRMFTLVSGTDEFVNFGSVKEIEAYFDKPNRSSDEKPEDLLNTMREFSNAIKICRTNKIEEEVKKLKNAIDIFSDKPKKSVHEKMFDQIITVLRREYNLLLSDCTKPDIIRWCVNKGFLQQAMTLCTEWLPLIYVSDDYKICYPLNKEKIKTEIESTKKDSHREWEKAFIIDYTGPSNKKGNKPGGYSKAIEYYWRYLNNGNNSVIDTAANAYPQKKKQLRQLFTEIEAINNKDNDVFLKIEREEISIETFRSKYPWLDKVYGILYKKQGNSCSYLQFLKKKETQNAVNILKVIQKFDKKEQEELLGSISTDSGKVKNGEENSDKWEIRKKQYENMYDKRIIGSRYKKEIMLDFLEKYFVIRNERNKINHAGSDEKNLPLGNSKTTTEEYKRIKELIIECLDKLEKTN